MILHTKRPEKDRDNGFELLLRFFRELKDVKRVAYLTSLFIIPPITEIMDYNLECVISLAKFLSYKNLYSCLLLFTGIQYSKSTIKYQYNINNIGLLLDLCEDLAIEECGELTLNLPHFQDYSRQIVVFGKDNSELAENINKSIFKKPILTYIKTLYDIPSPS